MAQLSKISLHEQENAAADMPFNEITAYFQPIIAADTKKIYSYEVLGRYTDGGSVQSLGPFFSSASDEDALTVDRIVRKCALERFANEGNGEYLFLNMRLNWIACHTDISEELPTLRWAREYGIDPRKLVIEVTEEDFYRDDEKYIKVLNRYKNAGCRIAIDDFGKNASNIDRLALLSPDIMKIDMDYVHRSEDSYHYREYLKTLSSFAEYVGIEVLYEGVETQEQLDICIASKGRFFQGFLLAKPQPSIRDSIYNHEVFSLSTKRAIESRRESAKRTSDRLAFWDAMIEGFVQKYDSEFSMANMDNYLDKLCRWLPVPIKRVYLCNRDGHQLSHNIEAESGNVAWLDYRNRNWAWRGFFQEAMASIDSGMKSCFTNTYRDVTTKEKICTYVHQIRSDLCIFIDFLKTDRRDAESGR